MTAEVICMHETVVTLKKLLSSGVLLRETCSRWQAQGKMELNTGIRLTEEIQIFLCSTIQNVWWYKYIPKTCKGLEELAVLEIFFHLSFLVSDYEPDIKSSFILHIRFCMWWFIYFLINHNNNNNMVIFKRIISWSINYFKLN